MFCGGDGVARAAGVGRLRAFSPAGSRDPRAAAPSRPACLARRPARGARTGSGHPRTCSRSPKAQPRRVFSLKCFPSRWRSRVASASTHFVQLLGGWLDRWELGVASVFNDFLSLAWKTKSLFCIYYLSSSLPPHPHCGVPGETEMLGFHLQASRERACAGCFLVLSNSSLLEAFLNAQMPTGFRCS